MEYLLFTISSPMPLDGAANVLPIGSHCAHGIGEVFVGAIFQEIAAYARVQALVEVSAVGVHG